MIIDCDMCAMRDTSACEDCVVTFLVGDGPHDVDDVEENALGALAEGGLVPRLRLVPRGERAS